jgi:hypothetical protein
VGRSLDRETATDAFGSTHADRDLEELSFEFA